MTRKISSPIRDGRKLLDAGDAEPVGRVRAEDGDAVAALGVRLVEESSGAEVGPDRVEQLERGSLDGELEIGSALRVVDRRAW